MPATTSCSRATPWPAFPASTPTPSSATHFRSSPRSPPATTSSPSGPDNRTPPGGMTRMPRDIRELANDPAAYAAELERRWGGLLSYRYIGRKHSSMDTGPVDNTVTLRRDMRNSGGGLLVAPLSISSPEGAVGSDRETVPNPVIHSCQILDPGHDVARIEVVDSESLHLGSRMGYSRSKIVDADDPGRVIALAEGQGVKIGTVPDGLEKMPPNPLEIMDSPDLPPLWQVFGAFRRQDGHWGMPELRVDLASPDAA